MWKLQSLLSFESTVVLSFLVVSVILRTGWNKEEQEGGESIPLTDKVKVDLAAWNFVSDIDEYYSENFRYCQHLTHSRNVSSLVHMWPGR
jgi:hypothetical protein